MTQNLFNKKSDMKKVFLSVAVLLLSLRSFADEGMWLPMLLGKQVYADMVKKGLKLTSEQLYSVNKASIKDAIIIFGGGCTGEIVSNQGLIFTNHHCGYGAIAAASTVEHNYLKDGFWAANKQEEIPTKLSVKFLNRIEDVTTRVMSALGKLEGDARTKKLAEISAEISKEITGDSEFKDAVVASMFKGNQYFVYVYDVFKDIRFVGTPPEAIGKYGGDTDNWEWPRHTGDFSVFRVYADAKGKPASYNANNKPLTPKKFLPVSIKGVKNGDFAMIFGYPGGTNRYETSYGINLATEINNPSLVKLREMRLKHMMEQMRNDPAVKLQLASSYASIANYWKFFDGETKQLKKFRTFEQKQKAEANYIKWADGKAEYEHVFPDYKANYNAWVPYAKQRVYLNEGINGSPLLKFAGSLMSLEKKLADANTSKEDLDKAVKAADRARTSFIEGENKPSDQKIVADALKMFYEDIINTQQPTGFYNNLHSTYGNGEEAYKKYAAEMFSTTIILDDTKWKNFVANPSAKTLHDDLAYKTASAFVNNYNDNYADKYAEFNTKNNDLGRLYLKGIMEMNSAKAAKMYPDANFTMRVSYGKVQNYKPRDGVAYDYVTTMKGVMEKYVPGDYEFDLPAKFIDLVNKKDYGRYIDKAKNDLVVGFITSNDITGGNSGSPVINGNGELIGLAFDGNYEALSHKLAFDKDLNRTINVDVRYVLWCIEKLGGAKHIIDELKIVSK